VRGRSATSHRRGIGRLALLAVRRPPISGGERRGVAALFSRSWILWDCRHLRDGDALVGLGVALLVVGVYTLAASLGLASVEAVEAGDEVVVPAGAVAAATGTSAKGAPFSPSPASIRR